MTCLLIKFFTIRATVWNVRNRGHESRIDLATRQHLLQFCIFVFQIFDQFLGWVFVNHGLCFNLLRSIGFLYKIFKFLLIKF
jgi:hypothetical protein